MSFYLKYELSRLLHADGAKTFQAIEKSSRQNVLLHLVDKAATPELVQKVKRLESSHDTALVEVGEFAGSYYVVTRPIDDFSGLESWLDMRVSGLRTLPVMETPNAAQEDREPEPAPSEPTPAPAAHAAPSRGAVAAEPAPDSDGPGEFTRMFGGGAGDSQPAAPTAEPAHAETRREPAQPTSPTILDPATATPSPPPQQAASTPPTSTSSEGPGEFTRLFGEPDAPSPPPPAAPPPTPAPAPPRANPSEPQPTPPAGAEPGEFTQLFGESEQEEPAAAPPTPPVAAPPEASPAPLPAADEQPGEFTQMFGEAAAREPAPVSAPPPPPPSAPSTSSGTPVEKSSGEFTQLFGEASGDAPGEQVPRLQPTASAEGGDVEKSSGEFTRLFGPDGKGAQTQTPPSSEPKSHYAPPAEQPPGPSADTPREAVPRLEPTASAKGGDIEKSSGEFTRLFGPDGKGAQAKAPSRPEPPKPQYAPPAERPLGSSAGAPGEFTRMFGGGSSGSSSKALTGFGNPPPPSPAPEGFDGGLVGEISGDEALDPSQGQRVSKSSKPFQAPGEFTRMFGPSDPSQQQAQDFVPAAQKGDDGHASGLFRNPHAEPAAPQGGASASQSAAGEGQTAAPGDYTKMFEGGGAAAAPPAPAASAEAPMAGATPAEPVKSGPGKGMLIALVVAVIVAGLSLGAAVYLFFNRDSGEPAEDTTPAIEQPADPGAGDN